jgi:hypothetical protein
VGWWYLGREGGREGGRDGGREGGRGQFDATAIFEKLGRVVVSRRRGGRKEGREGGNEIGICLLIVTALPPSLPPYPSGPRRYCNTNAAIPSSSHSHLATSRPSLSLRGGRRREGKGGREGGEG